MTTPKPMPIPHDCPHCGKPGRIMVALGNNWVGCHIIRECPARDHHGIAIHKRRAINEWNRWVEAQRAKATGATP